jgi:SAM-dependent MidA family methyltransferase
LLPTDGSDFATAPEMSKHFGQCLAGFAAHAMQALQVAQITEFGAGSGALAHSVANHLLSNVEQTNEWISWAVAQKALKTEAVLKYGLVEVSGALVARQQATLAAFDPAIDAAIDPANSAHFQFEWHTQLPETLSGVVWGNEVLDAMPVKLLARTSGAWFERGVALDDQANFVWQDRPTTLRPGGDFPGQADVITEIAPQAEAFMRTVAQAMLKSEVGAVALWVDYGFPEREYYHPARHMGTLMCHQGHKSDLNPLMDVGAKDITAHVNFTAMAVAAQQAGLDVLGYTSQGRFLLNAGFLELLQEASLAERAVAQKLVTEHEMGELFKVLAVCTPNVTQRLLAVPGFQVGDRSHSL